MLTSLISWGLSLIFSGLLVREMARRVKGMDYRAAGAAGYLGLGAVWALGLVVLGSDDDGDKERDPAGALRHQRADSSAPDTVPLAEPGDGGGADRGLGGGCLFLRSVGGECADGRGLRHRVRTGGPAAGAEVEARRMAGIQSCAFCFRGGTVALVFVRRFSHVAAGCFGGARSQHLQLNVPHRRVAAALASKAFHARGLRRRFRQRAACSSSFRSTPSFSG